MVIKWKWQVAQGITIFLPLCNFPQHIFTVIKSPVWRIALFLISTCFGFIWAHSLEERPKQPRWLGRVLAQSSARQLPSWTWDSAASPSAASCHSCCSVGIPSASLCSLWSPFRAWSQSQGCSRAAGLRVISRNKISFGLLLGCLSFHHLTVIWTYRSWEHNSELRGHFQWSFFVKQWWCISAGVNWSKRRSPELTFLPFSMLCPHAQLDFTVQRLSKPPVAGTHGFTPASPAGEEANAVHFQRCTEMHGHCFERSRDGWQHFYIIFWASNFYLCLYTRF